MARRHKPTKSTFFIWIFGSLLVASASWNLIDAAINGALWEHLWPAGLATWTFVGAIICQERRRWPAVYLAVLLFGLSLFLTVISHPWFESIMDFVLGVLFAGAAAYLLYINIVDLQNGGRLKLSSLLDDFGFRHLGSLLRKGRRHLK